MRIENRGLTAGRSRPSVRSVAAWLKGAGP
jgi:hypothetical protein